MMREASATAAAGVRRPARLVEHPASDPAGGGELDALGVREEAGEGEPGRIALAAQRAVDLAAHQRRDLDEPPVR